jgi:hypothetical protein
MAENTPPAAAKSLEMRIAELEDKLSKMHITEDEMKAYHKVSSLVGGMSAGGAAAASGAAAAPLDCVSGCINECAIRSCTIARFCTVVRNCTILRQCTVIRNCTFECFECGGGCAPGGGGFSGGGFGGFGG